MEGRFVRLEYVKMNIIDDIRSSCVCLTEHCNNKNDIIEELSDLKSLIDMAIGNIQNLEDEE